MEITVVNIYRLICIIIPICVAIWGLVLPCLIYPHFNWYSLWWAYRHEKKISKEEYKILKKYFKDKKDIKVLKVYNTLFEGVKVKTDEGRGNNIYTLTITKKPTWSRIRICHGYEVVYESEYKYDYDYQYEED